MQSSHISATGMICAVPISAPRSRQASFLCHVEQEPPGVRALEEPEIRVRGRMEQGGEEQMGSAATGLLQRIECLQVRHPSAMLWDIELPIPRSLPSKPIVQEVQLDASSTLSSPLPSTDLQPGSSSHVLSHTPMILFS